MRQKQSWRASRLVLLTAVLAVLVTVGCLVVVVLLRQSRGEVETAPAQQGATSTTPANGCGDAPCQVLTSTDLGGVPVELLADASGRAGRLRVGGSGSNTVIETTITAMGVRLNQDSLRCAGTTTRACLVRGPGDGGMVGQVLLARGDSWRPADRPYFSDAGSIALNQISGDDTPEVIVVRHDCGASGNAANCQSRSVLAEVFDVSGEQLGCTGKYTSPSQLRGWPEVRPRAGDLRRCR